MNGNIKLIKSTYYKGLIAEFYVLIFLLFKGYRPVKWRMRNKITEIDLIVIKRGQLIAVEVKYRKYQEDSLWAVHTQQKHKIRQALEIFGHTYPKPLKGIRCDFCGVSQYGKIIHLKNAF